jgi:hypothetical protein
MYKILIVCIFLGTTYNGVCTNFDDSPTIVELRLNPSTQKVYVKPGNVKVTIIFSTKMDLEIQPIVTYGCEKPYTDYEIEGDWLSSCIWEGLMDITASMADGTYTIRVVNATDLKGNTMLEDTNHTFILDTERPYIISTYPPHNAVDVPLNVTISITFNEPMNTDMTNYSVTISGGIGAKSFLWDNNTLKIEIHPRLQPNTIYSVTVDQNARDLAGNSMKSYTFTFATMRYRTIHGKIIDVHGNPISDVFVSLSIHPKPRSTTTNLSGVFIFANIPPGIYTINISKKGYGNRTIQVNLTEKDASPVIILQPTEKPTKIPSVLVIIILIVVCVPVCIGVGILVSKTIRKRKGKGKRKGRKRNENSINL